MPFATKIYEAFKNEPEKAKILSEFAEAMEKSLEISSKVATKDDLEKTKLELQYQIKSLDAKVEIKLKELEGKIETTRAELELKIEKTKNSLLKWSFLFWLSQMATLFVILFTILKTLDK
ncbi:MAG: hypothetical protein ACK4UJ_06945 [Leptonema sp. (in: bacteria)]